MNRRDRITGKAAELRPDINDMQIWRVYEDITHDTSGVSRRERRKAARGNRG